MTRSSPTSARVRPRHLRSEFAAPGFQRDNGFSFLHRVLRRLDETMGIAYRFQKQGDNAGCFVLDSIIKRLADRHYRFVPGADQQAQAYRLLVRVVRQVCSQRAALGKQRHRPYDEGVRAGVGHGLDVPGQVHKAQAVRAEHCNIMIEC